MSSVGKILVSVATIAGIVALNVFVPGGGLAVGLGTVLGVSSQVAGALIIAIGSVAISLGGALLSQALFGRKIDMGSSKINFRQEEMTRWNNAGPVLQGGAVVFAEYDTSGNFWYVIAHCDSILTSDPDHYFDSQLVTVSSSTNEVTGDDYTFDGNHFFKVWTYTYTEDDPTPEASTVLETAFPSRWDTTDHLLVGMTYSVIYCRAIKLKNRYKIYKWAGPIGLGEPNVSVFGEWSNMYDPRDGTQTLGDRTTYKPSRNSALVWAWWRTHPFGRGKSESDINWDKVAEMADICDEEVVGIETTQPRYECAIGAQDNVDRATIENYIMLSCDGQLIFDDDGKVWMQVGDYTVPTLSLNRNRDIVTMSSVEAQDGESETQGVVVRYTDHNANFTTQSSAPWYNPNYYVAGQGNTFMSIDIPTIFNHNQAMRVAKGIGYRSQPTHKLAPVVGLRGLRAMQERIVDITYDNEFAGDYEIAAPVDVDETGLFCTLGLVPIDENRWDLLSGEEKPRPTSTESASTSTLSLPTGVTVDFGVARIEATFDTPLREDVTYEFQYILQSNWADSDADQWSNMTVDMDTLFAYSGAVSTSVAYYVRWRTVSSGGATTAWYDPPHNLAGVEATLSGVTNLTATPATGEVTIQWKNPTDSRFSSTDHYRGTTTTFADATLITSDYGGGLGQVQSFTDTIAAGTYYYWIIATDGDALEADPDDPGYVEAIVT